jgi:hypothetical protein
MTASLLSTVLTRILQTRLAKMGKPQGQLNYSGQSQGKRSHGGSKEEKAREINEFFDLDSPQNLKKSLG